jgi:hypothetical protein
MRNGRTDAFLGIWDEKRILSGWGPWFCRRSREFADHIQCDPELAQELYFEHKVSEALDNEQKASVDRELSTLRIVIVG